MKTSIAEREERDILAGWQIGRVQPFPTRVPERWGLVRLIDVATLESGHTPSRHCPDYWKGDIPWISLHDTDGLDVPEIFDTAQTIGELGLANSSARLLPRGTVVFSRTATVGKATVMGRSMATSQDFANYVCSDRVHNHFLVHLFRFLAPEWKRLKAGSTLNTIYMPVFRDLQVLLPPLPEQQAIASALSDVDALLGALDRLIAKKRDLKQAAMQQLLTGQTRLPGFSGKWETKRLADIGRFIKGRGIKKEEARSGELPCVRYGEIYTHHNDVVRRFNSWIARDVAATATRLHAGDVLFAGSGETKEEIGKAVVFVDQVEAYAGGDIVILRPTGCDPVFLGYLLNTTPVVAQKASYGQGDAVVHISASSLGRVQVKLPESAEQSAIATILTDMDTELTALEQRRDKTRLLKQGMMQELLTGRTRLV
ncbi:MAG TPA: restriction endonuclease subunit S [Pseudomonadota bacterium]|nr:restriction endonuclease subunit S [Pseudomonadota bacterium]